MPRPTKEFSLSDTARAEILPIWQLIARTLGGATPRGTRGNILSAAFSAATAKISRHSFLAACDEEYTAATALLRKKKTPKAPAKAPKRKPRK